MNRERIIATIEQFAASPKNVRFEELENLLDTHIKPMFPNYNHHHGSSHHAFTVGGHTFNVAKPHKGRVKQIYVKKFLEAMEAAGLYTPGAEK
jgi:hypothetical protein